MNRGKAFVLGLAVYGAVAVAACATGRAVKTLCLPLTPYTAAEQKQAARELAALPPGAVLARMLLDYGRMRAADRACAAPPPLK